MEADKVGRMERNALEANRRESIDFEAQESAMAGILSKLRCLCRNLYKQEDLLSWLSSYSD